MSHRNRNNGHDKTWKSLESMPEIGIRTQQVYLRAYPAPTGSRGFHGASYWKSIPEMLCSPPDITAALSPVLSHRLGVAIAGRELSFLY